MQLGRKIENRLRLTGLKVVNVHMKIAILDSAYWGSLRSISFDLPPLASDLLEDLSLMQKDAGIGSGSMYLDTLSRMGHECLHIVCNSRRTQLKKKNSKTALTDRSLFWKKWQAISRVPIFGRHIHSKSSMMRIALLEIKNFRPDVLLVININLLLQSDLQKIQNMETLVVGQHASPLPPGRFWRGYDAMISAHPGQVEFFRRAGIVSYSLPLAVGDDFVSENTLSFSERKRDTSFIGSFSRHHSKAGNFFRAIGEALPSLQIFTLTSIWKLRWLRLDKYFMGSVSGKKVHEIYGESKIVLNRHIKMADGFAVNFRMYEAAAAGALLLTEEAPNLHELFIPGVEVLTYSSKQDAIKKIKWALSHTLEASEIAAAGKRRVMESHLMSFRSAQLGEILAKLFKGKGGDEVESR
jgi:hypothetical protein